MSKRRVTLFAGSVVLLVAVFAAGQGADRSLPTDERAEVQAAAVTLLEAEVALGRLPDDVAGRSAVLRSGRGDRRAALERIWVPSEVDGAAADWEEGLALVADDREYEAYSDNRLVVSEWESAERTDEGVALTFTGQMEYRVPSRGAWVGEPLSRYEVDLQPAPGGGWRLAEAVADSLEGNS